MVQELDVHFEKSTEELLDQLEGFGVRVDGIRDGYRQRGHIDPELLSSLGKLYAAHIAYKTYKIFNR